MYIVHYTSGTKVHLAYAHVATKQLRMCGTRKIFHAAGFMCAHHHSYVHQCTRADTAIFVVVTLSDEQPSKVK